MRENFMKGNYGIFVHYLVKYNDRSVSAEEWNRQTAGFDAEGLARQAHEAGAKWLYFTMGQASGHYAAPNAAFDEISAEKPSKCSERDLYGKNRQVFKGARSILQGFACKINYFLRREKCTISTFSAIACQN